MWILAFAVIVTLIILGVVAMLVEMLLLPGLTIGALFALGLFSGAAYVAFDSFGVSGGVMTIVAICAICTIAVVLTLRSKTWERVKLHNALAKSKAKNLPSERLTVGDIAVTVSRLSPMGTIYLNGETFEAKSLGGVVDPKRKVKIKGFENSAVLVLEVLDVK